MRLYVLRHADAEEQRHGQKDAERRLTARGHAQARAVAHLFAKGKRPADVRPERIIQSAAVRARETGAALEAELGLRAEVDARIGLDADEAQSLALVSELAAAGRVCVLVGHNPTLEDLLGHLGGAPSLKKGQLVALEVALPKRGLRAEELGRFRSDD